MHLTLYIPGLLDAAAAVPHAHTPSLSQLLADATARVEAEGALALIAPLYGVARQQDWPLAPLRLAAFGASPGTRYWLRARPVTLQATRDGVRLEQAVDDLAREEADTLLSMLATHFERDGLAFLAPRPSDWYVGLEDSPELHTESLTSVIGRPLRDHVPRGAGAAVWRRWQQEIEMLLHDHPVNGRREQNGRTIVNAVWLQHGGRMPTRAGSPQVDTLSDDDDLLALSHHIARPAHASPDDLSDVLGTAAIDRLIVSTSPARTLEALEPAFAGPILDALRSRRVDRVEVIGDGVGKPALHWTCRRASWLQRLVRRRPAPLRQLVASALEST